MGRAHAALVAGALLVFELDCGVLRLDGFDALRHDAVEQQRNRGTDGQAHSSKRQAEQANDLADAVVADSRLGHSENHTDDHTDACAERHEGTVFRAASNLNFVSVDAGNLDGVGHVSIVSPAARERQSPQPMQR